MYLGKGRDCGWHLGGVVRAVGCDPLTGVSVGTVCVTWRVCCLV